MARLKVGADAATLQRALVAVIGRAVEHSEGAITVRTTKQRTAARIEVTGEEPREHPPTTSAWPATLVADVEAMHGRLSGGDDAVVWLAVPLSGPSAPDS